MVLCIDHDVCKGNQDSQFLCLLNNFGTTGLGLQSVCNYWNQVLSYLHAFGIVLDRICTLFGLSSKVDAQENIHLIYKRKKY